MKLKINIFNKKNIIHDCSNNVSVCESHSVFSISKSYLIWHVLLYKVLNAYNVHNQAD